VPPQADSKLHREDGTASVELIGAIPFLLLAVLVAVQIALAGQALWSAGIAARAGARAALVGGDAAAVARRGLPPSMREDAKVGASSRSSDPSAPMASGTEVSVRVRVPRLLPGLPVLMVGAKSDLGSGNG
jgi:hypothetical protein